MSNMSLQSEQQAGFHISYTKHAKPFRLTILHVCTLVPSSTQTTSNSMLSDITEIHITWVCEDLDKHLALQLRMNGNKPNSAKTSPSPNLSPGGSGWGTMCTSSSWHQQAVRRSCSWQSIEQSSYEDQAQKAVSATMPQQ